jgi:uncharacterized protein
MGTRVEGGLKAAQKNTANEPGFYKRIGAIGGRNGHIGGFNDPEVAHRAGVLGGRKSHRGPRNKAYNEEATCNSEKMDSRKPGSTSKAQTSKCSDCKREVPTDMLDDMGLCPDCPRSSSSMTAEELARAF